MIQIDEQDLVSVLILNWNREKETIRAIESAIKQTYNNIEIIVVDNGSTDASVSSIKENYPFIKLIELPKNFGCPGGRNKGIKHCSGKFIFFLDNDGVLHKDAVLNAVKAIKQDPNYFVVTGQIYDFNDENEIDSSFDEKYENENTHVRSFQGGISLHNKSVYNLIGLYPDDFMYGGEEQHLSLRILDYGKTIVKNKSVILWHKKSNIERDTTNEAIQAMINTFITYYGLLPWYMFLLFSLKYFLYYTFLAFRNKYGILFIKRNIKELPKRVKATERSPVSLNTFLKRMNLPIY